MPGFATGEATKSNAWALMRALGIVGEEIDIRPAAMQMLKDMGHPFAEGEAGLRHHLRERAGGASDRLSLPPRQPARRLRRRHRRSVAKLALGWCTYGVGDQMSHYGVNAGVPKTLIQYLIRWAVKTGQFDAETDRILEAILATKISPELVPADDKGEMQSTEDTIGPYELHDFFLFHILRSGQPPSKVAFLAWQAWHDAGAGTLAARLSRGAEARLRPADDPQVAGGVPLPLLPDQPVQALRHAQFAQGVGRRQRSARAATGARRRTGPPGRGWTSSRRRWTISAPVIASEAKQSSAASDTRWMAASLAPRHDEANRTFRLETTPLSPDLNQ